MRLVLLLGCLLTGCAYQYRLGDFAAQPADIERKLGIRVAVVIREPDVLDEYHSRSVLVNYKLKQVQQAFIRAFRIKLKSRVQEVKVLKSDRGAPKHVDVVLYPKLDLSIKFKLIGRACRAEYGLLAKGKKGRELANRSAAVEEFWMFPWSSESACNTAVGRIFDRISDNVLNVLATEYRGRRAEG